MICRRCGDHLLCRRCLAGAAGSARHTETECKRVRAMVRSAAEALVPRLRESARQVAVVRLNGSGLIVPVHITSIASPLIPSSLAEALSRCQDEVNDPAVVVHWRLLVAFLAKLEGDGQEAIDHEAVYHVQAAECASKPRRSPPHAGHHACCRARGGACRRKPRRPRREQRRRRVRLRRQRPWRRQMQCLSGSQHGRTRPAAILTSVLLKRGGTASPEVVARTRAKRDSLKAAEMRARKPAKAMPEERNAAERLRSDGQRMRGWWLRLSSSNGALARGFGAARSCVASSAVVPPSSFSSQFEPG